jgi:TPR repeat protein
MSVRTVCAALLAGALLCAAPAYADFRTAWSEYNAGHYEVARAQFLALAELGDCSSQFNLGAMLLKGQGGAKDSGSGVGWLQAAAGNGCEALVGNTLAALQASLSAEEARSAAAILARYGRDALHAAGIVNPDVTCHDQDAARVVQAAAPEYPRVAGGTQQSAIVITRLTIGVDGLARDPEILLAVPQSAFPAAAVESWINSRFTPALRGGRPVESRLPAKLVFAGGGAATLADAPALRQARPAAEAGAPAAGYLLGLAATFDASLGISPARASELLIGAARDGDPQAQYWLGSQLRDTLACHPQADGSLWLRHAAEGGSAAARLVLAMDLLRATPSAPQAAQARALLEQAASSDSYYVSKHVVALLAASPLDTLRDPATALSVARKLRAGEIQSDPQMFEAVAAAYAASGDFRNAVTQQQAAIRKAQDLGWNTRTMNDRLTAYRGGKAWYGDLFAVPPAGARGT